MAKAACTSPSFFLLLLLNPYFLALVTANGFCAIFPLLSPCSILSPIVTISEICKIHFPTHVHSMGLQCFNEHGDHFLLMSRWFHLSSQLPPSLGIFFKSLALLLNRPCNCIVSGAMSMLYLYCLMKASTKSFHDRILTGSKFMY